MDEAPTGSLSVLGGAKSASNSNSEDLAQRKYIRYEAGIEKIPEGETEDIEAVADMINQIQLTHWNMHRECHRHKH
jgi:hypothetical protein